MQGFSFKSDNARNKKAQTPRQINQPDNSPSRCGRAHIFSRGSRNGRNPAGRDYQCPRRLRGLRRPAPADSGTACRGRNCLRGPPPRSTDASISAADRRRDTMKTTLDGVVLLPHVSGHAKNGVSPQADFPGPSGGRETACAVRASRQAAVAGGKAAGRQRWQGGGRQATRQRAARRRAARRRAARRQSTRTAKWQGGKVAGRQSGRAARRQASRTTKVAGRQSGRAARWQGRRSAGRQKRGGLRFLKKLKPFCPKIICPRILEARPRHRSGRIRGAAHTNKKRARPITSARLAPGFQPPGAAGQRKRTEKQPGICKGQRTGSQYAVRTPEGCNIICTAAVSKIIGAQLFDLFTFPIILFESAQPAPSVVFPIPGNCARGRAGLRFRKSSQASCGLFLQFFYILCTISHKFYSILSPDSVGMHRHTFTGRPAFTGQPAMLPPISCPASHSTSPSANKREETVPPQTT